MDRKRNLIAIILVSGICIATLSGYLIYRNSKIEALEQVQDQDYDFSQYIPEKLIVHNFESILKYDYGGFNFDTLKIPVNSTDAYFEAPYDDKNLNLSCKIINNDFYLKDIQNYDYNPEIRFINSSKITHIFEVSGINIIDSSYRHPTEKFHTLKSSLGWSSPGNIPRYFTDGCIGTVSRPLYIKDSLLNQTLPSGDFEHQFLSFLDSSVDYKYEPQNVSISLNTSISIQFYKKIYFLNYDASNSSIEIQYLYEYRLSEVFLLDFGTRYADTHFYMQNQQVIFCDINWFPSDFPFEDYTTLNKTQIEQ